MNRLLKNLLIAMCVMGVVAVASALVAYYTIYQGEQQREEAEQAARKVLALEQDEIREITIEHADGKITKASKPDEDWLLSEPLSVAGDNTNWNSMARSLADAKSNRRIPMEEIAGADLGAFGLATPEIVVTVAGIGGATQEVLELGGDNPARRRTGSDEAYVGPQVYARIKDGDEILSIDETVKNAVNKQLFDLRDKRIVTFETDDVRRVEVSAGDLSYRLDRTGEDHWQVSQPMEAQVKTTEVTSLINKIRNGRIKQFIDERPENLAAYGLTNPVTRVVFWMGEEESPTSWASQAVLLGSTSEITPANVYGKRENQDNVFAVELSTFEIPGNIDDLRLRKLTPVNSWDVERMAVSVAGEKILEVSKSSGDWLQLAPAEGKCKWSSANDAIRKAVELEVADFIGPDTSEPELGLDENDVVIELGTKDGAEMIALSTIRGGTDGVRYGVRQPPREIYSVNADKVQEFLGAAASVELETPPDAEPSEDNEGDDSGEGSDS